jgi:protein required for attachment to host cells
VVADGGRARLFDVEPDPDAPCGMKLVERAAPGAPRAGSGGEEAPGAGERPGLELDRRFRDEIVLTIAHCVEEWDEGSIVLVAEPRMLGFLHEALRGRLPPRIELKELAKDYTRLTAAELREHLALSRLIPARRAAT